MELLAGYLGQEEEEKIVIETTSRPGPSTPRECGVCLEPMGKSKKPMILPCAHQFCETCVARLMTEIEQKCPVCRNLIDTPPICTFVDRSNLPVVPVPAAPSESDLIRN